jgi:hypothetical protein
METILRDFIYALPRSLMQLGKDVLIGYNAHSNSKCYPRVNIPSLRHIINFLTKIRDVSEAPSYTWTEKEGSGICMIADSGQN